MECFSKITLFMNKLCLLSLALACSANSFAQDVIITRDAKKLDTKITEVGVFVVKYKLASEVDGPTYVLPKDKVAAITYENGRVETYFGGQTVSSDSAAADSSDAANAAVADSAATATFVAKPVEAAPAPDYHYDQHDSPAAPDEQYRQQQEQAADNIASLHEYAEKVKGVRFKLEVAPLFGAHQHFYGYERDDDDDYYYCERHHDHYCNDVSFHDSTHSVKPGFSAAIGIGYQFNPVFYLGAGFDVATLDKCDWVALSEYIDLNVYCLRYKRTSPFVGLRAGITSLLEPDDRIGYFVEPQVGVCHRLSNPKLSLGFTMGYRVAAFDTDDNNCMYNNLYYDGTAASAYFAKFFFSF